MALFKFTVAKEKGSVIVYGCFIPQCGENTAFSFSVPLGETYG